MRERLQAIEQRTRYPMLRREKTLAHEPNAGAVGPVSNYNCNDVYFLEDILEVNCSSRRRTSQVPPTTAESSPLSQIRFLILLSLLDGDSYGYLIVKAVRERSEGRVRLLPGNLYATLQRLERDGLVERAGRIETGDRGGAPRNYFRITNAGHETVAAEALRLRRLVDAADVRKLIQDSG